MPLPSTRRAHGRDHLERKADAMRALAAVAVVARVERGQERRHRICVREVQLDAIEAGGHRACRGVGEQAREHLR